MSRSKQLETILMDEKLRKTTNLCVEIINDNQRENLFTWYKFAFAVMLNLSSVLTFPLACSEKTV